MWYTLHKIFFNSFNFSIRIADVRLNSEENAVVFELISKEKLHGKINCSKSGAKISIFLLFFIHISVIMPSFV